MGRMVRNLVGVKDEGKGADMKRYVSDGRGYDLIKAARPDRLGSSAPLTSADIDTSNTVGIRSRPPLVPYAVRGHSGGQVRAIRVDIRGVSRLQSGEIRRRVRRRRWRRVRVVNVLSCNRS